MEAEDFLSLIGQGQGDPEERDDESQQGGYRVTLPSTGQDSGTGERRPTPAAGSGTQVAELQPPSIADVMRSAPGAKPAPSTSPAQPSPISVPAGVMRSPNLAPGEVPNPPTGANNQRRVDLLRQMGTLEKPTDPRAVDPQTGKPMYRMSLGQRILGTVGNFATGFGRHGGPLTYVGPGATNSRFDQAEDMRQKTLGGVQAELGEQDKLDTSEQKMYEDAVKQAYEGQLGDYRTKLGNAAEEKAGIATQLANSVAEKNAAIAERDRALAGKAGQAKEPTNEIELLQAYQTAVVKKDPKAAIYKAAIEQLKQLKAAGKDTSAADLAKTLQVAEFRMREKDSADKEKEAERKQAYTELDKNLAVKYNPQAMAAEKAKIDQGLETKYAPKYQSIEDEAGQMLGLTKDGAKLQTPAKPGTTAPPATNAPGAPNAKPATAAKAPPKPTGPAAAGKVWVYDKTTGARGQIPQHQLAAATQGANAKYATW